MLKLPLALQEIIRRIDEHKVVDALSEVHARRTRRDLEARLTPDDAEAYTRAHELLRSRDQQRAREGEVLDQLLGQLAGTKTASRQQPSAATPPVPQQELVLLGAPGGHAAGRFRVFNEIERTAAFDFVVGACEDGAPPPPITFTPASVTLAPGASAVVGVRVDLAEQREERALAIPVDVRAGRDLGQRLWLTVRCVGA